ncbi:MAG: hypothetical protein ACPG5B_01440 [Chitinophagales bacterium]
MTLKHFFTQLYRNIRFGAKPIIDKHTYIFFSKKISLAANQHIADSIEDILCRFEYIKIGKTGYPKNRIDQEDYRTAPYEVMFLVLKSKSRKVISHYEALFINEFYDVNDNKSRKSGGYMRTPDGYFYLYVVAA